MTTSETASGPPSRAPSSGPPSRAPSSGALSSSAFFVLETKCYKTKMHPALGKNLSTEPTDLGFACIAQRVAHPDSVCGSPRPSHTSYRTRQTLGGSDQSLIRKVNELLAKSLEVSRGWCRAPRFASCATTFAARWIERACTYLHKI
jgi:hypothetical protein